MNILLFMIIAVLSILFLIGAVQRLLQRFEKPMPPNPRVIMDKAPGRILVRVIGIIYIALAFDGFLAMSLSFASSTMESITVVDIVRVATHLYIGIFAVTKYNDLTESYKLQGLAIFNLFLTITWIRAHILLVVIIVALSILFLIGAMKNYRAYQHLLQQGIRVEKPKGNSKEPMPAKPLGKTLLRIAGALLIIFVVIVMRHILPTSIMMITAERHNPLAWLALFVIFSPLCLGLFCGIFGVVKSNDLKKACTLRTLAITTIVLVGVLNAVARALPVPVLIAGLALLIPFFIGAQINYMEYKEITSATLRGEKLY